MLDKKMSMVLALVTIATFILAACTPAETQVETVIVTQVIVETVEVEVEGETQIIEVTKEVPIEVTREVVVTPEPEVEEEAELPAVNVSFANPDTYMVITGAGEPETLDPSWTYETAGSAVENNVYEGVVWFNKDKTDEYVPVLATDWSANEAGDVWTFNIRDGVTFHEGGTLEPHDIAYSVHRALLQDRIDGPHWMTLEAFFALYTIEDLALEISGAEAFEDVSEADLVATCEAVKAAVVADDEAGTVTYNLNTATPWFLAMLSNSFLGATYDMEWMAENGDWDGDCANWVQFHDPAAEETILFDKANGTGPYMLDHWTPGEEIVLTANPNYWRTEPIWEGGPSGVASIQRVVIKNINEWGTRLAMMEAGDADYIYVDPQYRPQLEPYYKTICYADGTCEEGNPDGYILANVNLPSVAMTPAQFNWQISVEGGNPFVGSGELDGNGIPPDFFSDIHVRKAFNYCFDFDTMIADALNGEGIQAQGPIIAGMMGYLEGQDPLYSYDPAMCEEEFKQAFDGQLWDTGFYLQLSYNTGNDTRRLASEILKAGIEAVNPKFSISVVGMPWPVLLNSRREQKLPLYVGGWLEDFHDPHNWVHPFLHSQGAYGRVINFPADIAAEYDALIEAAASSSDPAVRRPIYEEIQLKSQEDAAVIWMYQAVGRIHLQEWIQGWYYNPAYSAAAYSYVYALSKVAP
ncbi:MAG: ABC transporter substrate-binding protein [Anaerolineales bacterium]|nr:ABC transporter substrate-binding protein [Anaerolineales bacterium]